MKQRQKDLFAVRLRIPCGNVTSEQLMEISAIAMKYGSGFIHITTRQGIQIPDINIEDLDIVTEEQMGYGHHLFPSILFEVSHE